VYLLAEYAKLYAEAVLYVLPEFIFGYNGRNKRELRGGGKQKMSTHINLILSGIVISLLLYL